jgi:hypothetical protein
MNAFAKAGLIVLSALVAFEEFAFVAAHTDAALIHAGGVPVFSIPVEVYFDGGTTIYWGLGYRVISPPGIGAVKDSRGNMVMGYPQSPRAGINYWVPVWPVLNNRPAHAVFLPKIKTTPN